MVIFSWPLSALAGRDIAGQSNMYKIIMKVV